MKTLREVGEDRLIERLVRLVPRDPEAMAGPGDDCAVVDLGCGWLQLLKTDAVVERVHFLREAPARRVGWKAVARVVSDFAAMGGVPERFLVTVALDGGMDVEWVEDLYRGMGDCMECYGGVLAGGETSRVPDGSAAVITVAATGRVERKRLVLRSGARVGDVLLVTGTLGGSGQGRHLDFQPRVREAWWLTGAFKPTAMMDLSDGLAIDLGRLALASGCGWVVDREKLPVTAGCSVAQAMGDGEDFELLMAQPAEQVDALLATWGREFPGLPLTVVGSIVPAGEGEVGEGGWEHFRNDHGSG